MKLPPIVSRAAAATAVVLSVATLTVVRAPAASAATCSQSSLVSAIKTANNPGLFQSSTVTLTSGCTYLLSTVDNPTDGGNGLPVITGDVTIKGQNATIVRSSASGTPAFRLFDIASGASLTMSSVTLSNGLVPSTGSVGGAGALNRGTLTLTSVTFSGNTALAATGGGGIDNRGTGQVTVSKSTFTGNVALQGGGIEHEATACTSSPKQCGSATVTDTTFQGNSTTAFGGGGFEAQHNGSSTPLCPSTQNTCQLVGGAHSTLTNDTFVGNAAMTEGGGVANFGTMAIRDSTFATNRIIGTTIGDDGGAGVQTTGPLTITQSTFSANTSQYGANIHTYEDGPTDTANGATPTVSVSASIISGGGPGAACGGAVAIGDGGYNIDTGSSCGFTGSGTSRSFVQPRLEPLAANGGSTQTFAIPVGSPAQNAIPSGTSVCNGTDQRGTSRPQGGSCDIGAYEIVQTTGDTTAPSAPTGLTVTGTTFDSVSLSWTASTDNRGVTGYRIYRDGTLVGATGGPNATSHIDTTAAPGTTGAYTVRAFDGGGNLSAASSAVNATTPAPSAIAQAQNGSFVGSSRTTTGAIALSQVVHNGDLLVGWFAQYDATGQLTVSDDVNGAWTRLGPSTTFTNGGGDIALYAVQGSKPAPNGVTVTATASSPTYLQAGAADYTGVATTNALDGASVGSGNSTAADSGPTTAVPDGDLVIGDLLTGGAPGTVTPGTSQGQPFAIRGQSISGAVTLTDIPSATAGPQDFTATLGNATDWYAVAAAFHPWIAGPPPPPPPPPPPSSVAFVQGGALGNTSGISVTMKLTQPVASGDVLVGWFGSSGNLTVSDNRNGSWTRIATESYGNGTAGLYYVRSAASSTGLTITLGGGFLLFPNTYSGAVAEYSGVNATQPIVASKVGHGTGTAVDSGATTAVAAGQLVVGALLTGSSPTSFTPGSTQGVPFVSRAQTSSGSSAIEDVLTGAAGTQNATGTLGRSVSWYAATAVLAPA